MIDNLTNKILIKLQNELAKDENKKKINDLINPIITKIFYILVPYLGCCIFLYLLLLILIIYIIFILKKISNKYI
jgi:hypothetical protein